MQQPSLPFHYPADSVEALDASQATPYSTMPQHASISLFSHNPTSSTQPHDTLKETIVFQPLTPAQQYRAPSLNSEDAETMPMDAKASDEYLNNAALDPEATASRGWVVPDSPCSSLVINLDEDMDTDSEPEYPIPPVSLSSPLLKDFIVFHTSMSN